MLFLIDPPKPTMIGGLITICTITHITAIAELLAGALTTLGGLGWAPVFAEASLPGIIKILSKIGVVIITLDLPKIDTRVAYIKPLVILGRHGGHFLFLRFVFSIRKKNEGCRF